MVWSEDRTIDSELKKAFPVHCSLLTAHCSLLTAHWSLLFQHPFSVLPNFFVHSVRSKVKLARPSHHSNLEMRLCEQGRIAQGGKDAGLVRKDEARHINRSFHAIKETDLKLIAREDSDFRYAP
jgi:hypothetical protein